MSGNGATMNGQLGKINGFHGSLSRNSGANNYGSMGNGTAGFVDYGPVNLGTTNSGSFHQQSATAPYPKPKPKPNPVAYQLAPRYPPLASFKQRGPYQPPTRA